MNKSFIFLALVCVSVLIATSFAANNVEISFKDSNQVFAKDLPSIVQIKLNDVVFTAIDGVQFTFVESQDERDARQDEITAGTWTFQPLTIDATVNGFNQNFIGYQDDSKALCVETTTGKPLGLIDISEDAFKLVLNDDADFFSERFDSADGYGTWTFECPIVFTQQSNAVNTFNVRAEYSGKTGTVYDAQTDNLSLQPGRPYFIVPNVEFRSLSLSQNTNDFFSSSAINFSFTTNSTGNFTVWVENGPWFLAYPTKRDEKPDFWCTAGDNKFRMVYHDSAGQVYIFVNVATDSTINCSAFVSQSATSSSSAHEAQPSVSTKRAIVTISHSDVKVKRAADWVFYPGYFYANVFQNSGGNNVNYAMDLGLTNLFYSTTPLRVNSTATFTFSQDLDVRTLDLHQMGNHEGYRAYSCISVDATVSIDASSNSIVLSDILDNNNDYSGLHCLFRFHSGIAQLYEKDRSLNVAVKIDGKALRSIESNTENAIVHFGRSDDWEPFVPALSARSGSGVVGIPDCQVNGDKLDLTYRFDFKDDYLGFGYAPINPLFIFSFPNPASYQFSQDELKDQLRCEATTATHSSFEQIDLTFDAELMIWTYNVKQVDDVEAYSIKFRCYRSETIRKQYGILLNRESDLHISYIDLERGNRYFDEPRVLIFEQSRANCYSKVAQDDPGASLYPKDPQRRFCASAPVALPSINDAAIAGAVAHLKSAFEAAVAAVDETKNVALSSWWTRQSRPPYADTSVSTQIAHEQAEQLYDMYHTQIDHDLVVKYRVEDGSDQFPALPYFESSSPSFSGSVLKYNINAQVCYVVSQTDFDLVTTHYTDIQEEFWHKEFVLTADQTHVPISAVFLINTDTVLQYSSTVSGCGLVDGLSVSPDAGSDTYTWPDYNNSNRLAWKRCLLGETCQLNTDCDQANHGLAMAVCKSPNGNSAKTCQLVPRRQSPWVKFSSGIFAEDRSDYAFNTASSVSIVFAAIIAVLALMF